MLVIAMFLAGSIGIAGAEGIDAIDDTGVQIAEEQSTDIDKIIEVDEETAVPDTNKIDPAFQEPITQNAIKSITVTSPNGGENWVRGTVHTIKWSSSGITGNVKIELLKGSSSSTIISNTPNDGSYGWTIPSGQALGNDYKVRITSLSYPSIKDTSNYNFIISSGYANAKFYTNQKTYTQVPFELVELTLKSTGTAPIWVKQTEKWKIENMATGTKRDLPLCIPVGYGSCANKKLLPGEKITKSWDQKDNEGKLVPPGIYIASAKYYKQDPGSGNPTAYIVYIVFTIYSKPKIEVEYPNGGEVWQRGTSKKIKWNSVGDVGSRVRIELLKNGAFNRLIDSSTSNDGSYSYTMPWSQTTGSNYKINIVSTSHPEYKDTSNNNFRVS